jgi:hypothetical protein
MNRQGIRLVEVVHQLMTRLAYAGLSLHGSSPWFPNTRDAGMSARLFSTSSSPRPEITMQG